MKTTPTDIISAAIERSELCAKNVNSFEGGQDVRFEIKRSSEKFDCYLQVSFEVEQEGERQVVTPRLASSSAKARGTRAFRQLSNLLGEIATVADSATKLLNSEKE